MIKAIIFDCFGVLVIDGWFPFKKKYFGQSTELLKSATEINQRANAGLISYDEFINQEANLANISPKIVRRYVQENVTNDELLDFIKRDLKPKYKLVMLSNVATNWLSAMFEPKELELFDDFALSFEIGATKPDRRAYEIAAEKAGVPLESCLMIDDQQRYCEAARDYGMKAIVYKDLDQLKKELDKVLDHK